ncbi:aminopeptidase N [Aurantimonas sp. VKM B-3413]|uniref:aminopeptidase N n=1 Tax=Aurantimonas sp. VKM B-3413 TaxID=2779401 RepID=UPI001E4051BA|nr:aminopeptidase N [Aurantimonas sp. VKM B-3413]MCB8836075.1 aminopeptidase N [Aurantimonas sp. VKM B-3413]
MLRTDDGQTIKLADYRPSDFLLHAVDMTIRLFEGRAEIETHLALERRPGVAASVPLELDGDELSLAGLTLDGAPLDSSTYKASPDGLTVFSAPASGRFTLTVATRLVPEENSKLMGLFRSNGIWCTQCEAEGFRRITYFLDRPDVLAPYRVRVEADKAAAPVLLSNGNPVESGDLPGGRHFAVWDDPFNKPSYLFAMVAGDLDAVHEQFTTASGRAVTLGVYTEKGRSAQAAYAMDALKRSMVWDERRFGREYDLDVFNVVAIADFNMGAMENKGLNVFNHKYVLLDENIATDSDYAGVETVIAHEYFHNWTGNRITCRDWFQLCLKEGLTVYRDQEFSADEREATVQRIGSVRRLKAHQFPEDQGPLQHPVRPGEYREINNFYTATVYDKGAELVRMVATILGRDGFRKGMDLYFDRHDGMAATIEEFLACFTDATGTDLTQFALWYAQAGTPTLSVSQSYDPEADRLSVTLKQALEPGAAATQTAPMHIPVRFGLVGSNGQDKEAVTTSEAVVGDVIHLREPETTVVFEKLGDRPYLSALRDFSAPVTLKHEQSEADRLALARLDPNLFNRWRILNDLVAEALTTASRSGADATASPFASEIVEAILASASDQSLEPAFRAQALALPGETDVARLVGENVDPDHIHAVVEAARRQIGESGARLFQELHAELASDGAFSPDAASAGQRALANSALAYLVAATGDPAPATRQFSEARNMTDRLSALSLLLHHFPNSPDTIAALAEFYERHEADELVLDKWFALQATIPDASALERVETLAAHPKFTLRNPNRVRALIGTFAAANQVAFHRADGAGYRWVADRLAEIDRINPQISARIATTFRAWRSLEPVRRDYARKVLRQLVDLEHLSKDLRDIVERSLR